MGGYLETSLTYKTATKLLFSHELPLNFAITTDESKRLIEEVERIEIDSILKIIDSNELPNTIEVTQLPQFGSVRMVAKVPKEIRDSRNVDISYAQIGFLLRRDPNVSFIANQKYGETHLKGAIMVGLVYRRDKKTSSSILTSGFCEIDEEGKQDLIVRKLFLRIIPLQLLLQKAKDKKVNVFTFIDSRISEKTQQRRIGCLKMICRELKQLNNDELNRRINNIDWTFE